MGRSEIVCSFVLKMAFAGANVAAGERVGVHMIRSFVFSQGKLLSQDVTMDILRQLLHEPDVHIWVDAESPDANEAKALLEDVFGFHPLSIEDCVNESPRPKVEEYDNYVFMVIHSVDFDIRKFRTTELNMFIGKNFLVTYHAQPLRCISTTIERVLRNAPLVAKAPDRLTYTILNSLLENYEPALDNLAAESTRIEELVLGGKAVNIVDEILRLKSEVQHLRQIIMPQRDVINRLSHGEFKIVRTHLLPYYRDLLDQLVRIGDFADNYGNSLTDTLQAHLNIQQVKLNEVIKVLTVLATLSVPILVITSYYGMNIKHFPPMDWTWGESYSWIFGITGLITMMVYLVLRRKKWM